MRLLSVEQEVARFVAASPLNRAAQGTLRLFDEPLLAVADAQDPLFEVLKQPGAVGPQHMSPTEWLPEGKVVISYFLPFTEEVRSANRGEGQPAMEWMYGRYEGEIFNNALRGFLVEFFQRAGYQVLSPALDSRFKVEDRRSNWSERHVAFVAGLGTFSLNCSLITKKGAAGRLGSVVASALLPVTERYYTKRDENCIRCGACIRRCPPQAISNRGKDHAICSPYLDDILAQYQPRYGCGKCQTGVPCESKIPRINPV